MGTIASILRREVPKKRLVVGKPTSPSDQEALEWVQALLPRAKKGLLGRKDMKQFRYYWKRCRERGLIAEEEK